MTSKDLVILIVEGKIMGYPSTTPSVEDIEGVNDLFAGYLKTVPDGKIIKPSKGRFSLKSGRTYEVVSKGKN